MDDSIVEKFISLTMLNTIYISNFVLNRPGARVFFNTYRFRDCASRPIIRRLEELRDEFRIEPWKKLEIFKTQKAYRFWDREPFQHLISVSRNFPTSIRFIFSFFHSIEPGRGEISLVEQSARSSAALPGRSRFDHITVN